MAAWCALDSDGALADGARWRRWWRWGQAPAPRTADTVEVCSGTPARRTADTPAPLPFLPRLPGTCSASPAGPACADRVGSGWAASAPCSRRRTAGTPR
eukprot:1178566-Prorocentrum_minimum.AAC.3